MSNGLLLKHEKDRAKDTKIVFLEMGIISTLLVLGTYNPIFDVVAFFVVSIKILLDNDSVGWIVFFNPFSSVFKLSPTSNTLSTILLILYVLFSVFRKRKINMEFFIRFILFCLFVLLTSAFHFDVSRTIKFFFGILFIYFALSDISRNIWTVFKFFISGVVLSSLVSLLKLINNPSLYYGMKTLGYVNAYQNRFAGMYTDPNYYIVNIIIAVCLVEILSIKKVISKTFQIILLISLLSFSFLTLSKSAIIMLIVPVIMMLLHYLQTKEYRRFLSLMVLLGIVMLVLLSLNIPQINTIIGRFKLATDTNSLTTGRYNKWIEYLDFFRKNIGLFLIGNGVGANLLQCGAPHNTYIDFVYYFGIVGSFLFFQIVSYINKSVTYSDKKVINYSVYISIIVAYFALSETFYFDFPIHILMGATVFRLDEFSNYRKSNQK